MKSLKAVRGSDLHVLERTSYRSRWHTLIQSCGPSEARNQGKRTKLLGLVNIFWSILIGSMQDLLLPIKTITLEGCGASWGILPRGPCLTLAPALPASVAPRLGRQLPDSGIEHSHWKQLGNHYVLLICYLVSTVSVKGNCESCAQQTSRSITTGAGSFALGTSARWSQGVQKDKLGGQEHQSVFLPE